MSRDDLRSLGLIAEADDGTGLVLMRRGPWMWALSLRMPTELGERYAAGAGLMLERLGDDIRRAFTISYGLGTRLQPSRETIQESWDRLPVAAALVDHDLNTRATNSAADDLFASRRYFLPMSRGRGFTAADPASRDLMIRNVNCIISGVSDREAFALDGLRGAPPLPVVVRAVGRMQGWERFRAISRTGVDCAVAFFGTPAVLSAQMPDRVFA